MVFTGDPLFVHETARAYTPVATTPKTTFKIIFTGVGNIVPSFVGVAIGGTVKRRKKTVTARVCNSTDGVFKLPTKGTKVDLSETVRTTLCYMFPLVLDLSKERQRIERRKKDRE